MTPHDRYQSFKQAVEVDVYQATRSFQQLEIDDPYTRYKCAKKVGKKSSFALARYFAVFGLNDAEKIRKLAYLIFTKEQEPIRALIPKITNFSLAEEDRFQIALAMAKNDGRTSLELFSGFELNHLTDGRLFLIAHAAFQENLRGSSKFVRNVPHLTEKLRFDLLIMRLQGDADKGLELIQLFDIRNPLYKFQAAKVCAAYDGRRLSQDIRRWGLREEEERFILAKISLENFYATS